MSARLQYLVGFVCILLIEIGIALLVNDDFVRPFFGDFLAVILLYLLFLLLIGLRRRNIFLDFKAKRKVAIYSLFLALFIETLQAFPFLKAIGVEEYALARIILGSVFDWLDVLAYTIGTGFILIVEYKQSHS